VRVVLDTNVLISGVFFGGLPQKILVAAYAGRLTAVVSPAILSEYRRVLRRFSRRVRIDEAEGLVDLLVLRSEMGPDAELPGPVCADPADDKFLACALHAGVRMIVSGDRGLLPADGYEGIRVVTPGNFAREWLR
jgi:putative PIN family toxin of toxin-antitoxin system